LDPQAKNEQNPLGGWTALTLLASALKVANSSGVRTYYSPHRRSQAEATP
jgi:hypothetical protein